MPYAVARPRPGSMSLRAQAILGCLLVLLTGATIAQRYQHALFRNPLIQIQPAETLRRLVENFIPETVIAQPTAFQQELAMTQTQLLDRWQPLVKEASEKFDVPQSWIRAVIQRESGGRTLEGEGLPITSRVGAIGLMQLMPATYRQMSEQYDLGRDPTNPRDNIFAGTAYLSWLKNRYGFPHMFAAYNYGPGNFDRFLADRRAILPAETSAYIKAITRAVAG